MFSTEPRQGKNLTEETTYYEHKKKGQYTYNISSWKFTCQMHFYNPI